MAVKITLTKSEINRLKMLSYEKDALAYDRWKNIVLLIVFIFILIYIIIYKSLNGENGSIPELIVFTLIAIGLLFRSVKSKSYNKIDIVTDILNKIPDCDIIETNSAQQGDAPETASP